MAMSETIEPVIELPKATLYMGRKVSVKQYESLEIGLHLPVDLPLRTDEDTDASYALAVGEAVRNGFQILKVQVYDQLGLEYTDNNGVIAEKVAAVFPGSKVANTKAAIPKAPAAPASPTPSGAAADGTVCPKCNGPMYDNRKDKKNPRQPDFKCKNYKECDGVIWPPKR